MNYKNLIGYQLDTNQFTSHVIENEKYAVSVVKKVIDLYGEEILKYMFLTDNKRYTTFKKDGVSLFWHLNEN